MSDADVKRTIERLYDEKDALQSQNQALQERIDELEEERRQCARATTLWLAHRPIPHPTRPTQGTDREMEKQFPDGDSESFR